MNFYRFLIYILTMVPSRAQSSRLSTYFALATILSLLAPAQALYIYIQEGQPKCFFEELPKDTLVVGSLFLSLLSQFYRS
jgi:hypothetical protein